VPTRDNAEDLQRLLATLVASVLFGAFTTTAGADMGLAPVSHIGWEANATTGGDICPIAPHDKCQIGRHTDAAGGFNYPDSVATDPRTGHVYVAEINNNRVQEMTSTGVFVSMFGWDVNATSNKRAGASQAEKNLCDAISADTCQAGTAGSRVGQLDSPESVAVDPSAGDTYVSEIATGDLRVDKYTHSGGLVWRIGKGVNRTTAGNLCTAREVERQATTCGPGLDGGEDLTQAGAFKFANQSGDLLAVDARRHLLYVGDEHRVQVFRTNGHWMRDIWLTSLSAAPQSSVVALALDRDGALYVVYRVGSVETLLPSEHANIIHKFNGQDEQVGEYSVQPISPGVVVSINGIAINAAGHIAMMGIEVGAEASGRFGRIYDARRGHLIGSFPASADNEGVALSDSNRLYVATAVGNEVVIYSQTCRLTRGLADAPPGEALAIGERVCG
jgi:hypothetical protein